MLLWYNIKQAMHTLKSQVNVKVLAVILPLLLVALLLAAFLLNSYVIKNIYAGFEANLSGELATVEKALEHAFMENDLQTVQQQVVDLSYHGQTRAIRILDQDGAIVASSIPAEVGIQLDLESPQCLACHADKTTATLSAYQLPADGRSGQLLLTAKPLENQIACQSCHAGGGANLGMILAEHDITALAAQVSIFTRGLSLGSGAFFLLLAGVLWISLHHLVGRPLQALVLSETNPRLAARQDEFGRLTRQFQDLLTAEKEKGSQLDAQRRNFNALLTLSESIDVTLTTEKVLQFAIGQVCEVTGFAAIAMRVFDADQKCFRLVAHNNMTPRMVEDLHCIPLDIGFTADVYKTHRAAYTSDMAADPRLESPAPLDAGYRSLISVPILSGERLMGSMELATEEVHLWSENEVRWLELMGRSIGNVLHHIETSHQLQDLAVMQERSRIAQEIHDGLAQLIGTLRMWAEEAQIALHAKDLEEVQDDLHKIELTARDAYASLREEILGLRETISPGEGIIPVIREFLSRYQRQWGVETKLTINQNLHVSQGQSWISPAAEIQLLRIIQEGLTNVRRHANASQVIVTLADEVAYLHVEICDNGKGFHPVEVPDEKLGLRIMRERAASVGGRVTVKSSAGEGTCLMVDLPRQAAQVPPLRIAAEEKS